MASEDVRNEEALGAEVGEEAALSAAREKAATSDDASPFDGVAGIEVPETGPGAGFPTASGKWGTAHNGDCLEVLKTYPSRNFDSLITDPPAGISYMDLAFDSDKGGRDAWVAWLTEVMAECFRVMKPGAHAFVWSIPRTSHWTATAIEDAGFTIRDRLTHLFDPSRRAQDFLDSLSAEQLELMRRAVPDQAAFLSIFGNGYSKGLSIEKSAEESAGTMGDRETINVAEETGEGKQRKRSKETSLPASEAAEILQGLSTSMKPAAEFWVVAQRPPEKVTCQELAEATGWRYKCSDREVLRESPEGEDIASRYGLRPFPPAVGGRANGAYYYIAQTRHALRKGDRSLEVARGLKDGSDRETAEVELRSWDYRPFTLSSVEANALKWGTGGLSVGGCRVGYETSMYDGAPPHPESTPENEAREAAKKREPAHLVITHSEECRWVPRREHALEDFQETLFEDPNKTPSLLDSAESANGSAAGASGGEFEYEWRCAKNCPARQLDCTWKAADPSTYFNQFPGEVSGEIPHLADFGKPARDVSYGYFPKAHVGERNRGLGDNIEAQDTVGDAGMRWRSMTGKGPLAEGEKAPQKGGNTHATVKPLSLMRHLVRLSTLREGLVLDPFMGSGSTLCAAAKDGRLATGIEMDPHHFKVSVERARHYSGKTYHENEDREEPEDESKRHDKFRDNQQTF